MTEKNSRKIFVSLAVRDLKRSMEFFTRLGLAFNPQSTDEKAACMILNEEAFVMLLHESFFKTFTRKEICDTSTHTEGAFALLCDSRAEVDELAERAITSGGARAMDPEDHGFMYSRSFYDLDGHHWKVVWMDPKTLAGQTSEQN